METNRRVEFAAILDGLNAWDALDQFRRKAFARQLAYGPKAVQSPRTELWVGVVIWSRAPGYFGYKTLTLTGVWIVDRDGQAGVIVGQRHTAFAHGFYDPEAYHKLIRKDYAVYYKDDGRPASGDQIRAQMIYQPEERLNLRQWLVSAINSTR